jgi:hypothetical protein
VLTQRAREATEKSLNLEDLGYSEATEATERALNLESLKSHLLRGHGGHGEEASTLNPSVPSVASE